MHDAIPSEHPVFRAFEMAGYRPDDLLDPSEMTPEMVMSGDYRLVQWNSHGIEMFDVSGNELTDDVFADIDYGVEFGNHATQPIDFDDPLNERLNKNPMTALRADANPSVVFFARRDQRAVPETTAENALRALSLWGSEGFVPKDTAESMLRAVGGDPEMTAPRDDPDVHGLEIVRAPHVVEMMASTSDGVDAKTPDSDVLGHKKRRRQNFYRNFDALKDAFDVEIEE